MYTVLTRKIKVKEILMNQDKKKRVNLSLDKPTLKVLQEISDTNAYGSISSTIRILTKKYGKQELRKKVQ